MNTTSNKGKIYYHHPSKALNLRSNYYKSVIFPIQVLLNGSPHNSIQCKIESNPEFDLEDTIHFTGIYREPSHSAFGSHTALSFFITPYKIYKYITKSVKDFEEYQKNSNKKDYKKYLDPVFLFEQQNVNSNFLSTAGRTVNADTNAFPPLGAISEIFLKVLADGTSYPPVFHGITLYHALIKALEDRDYNAGFHIFMQLIASSGWFELSPETFMHFHSMFYPSYGFYPTHHSSIVIENSARTKIEGSSLVFVNTEPSINQDNGYITQLGTDQNTQIRRADKQRTKIIKNNLVYFKKNVFSYPVYLKPGEIEVDNAFTYSGSYFMYLDIHKSGRSLESFSPFRMNPNVVSSDLEKLMQSYQEADTIYPMEAIQIIENGYYLAMNPWITVMKLLFNDLYKKYE